jgi:hypothetical protein
VLGGSYELEFSEYEAMPERTGASFRCSFVAMSSKQQFRPLRSTPKPFVQGPQTAMVVGPAGEEIYTDKYGRVKVQFHWDRLGKKDENSSCWIRVSHRGPARVGRRLDAAHRTGGRSSISSRAIPISRSSPGASTTRRASRRSGSPPAR